MDSSDKGVGLKHTGRGMQLGSAMFLLGGGAGLVSRVVGGEWPEVMGCSRQPLLSLALFSLAASFGVTGIILGHRARQGNRKGCMSYAVIAWIILLALLLHLAWCGSGWYEVLIAAFLALDTTVLVALRMEGVPRRV